MKKKIERRADHNTCDCHRDTMAKRITVRDARVPTVRKVKMGKYIPRTEDIKHLGWIAAARRLAALAT